MEGVNEMKGILVFGGSGPLLILSSYPTIDHPDLVSQLRAKGLDKFMAWEIPVERCRDLYGYSYRDIAENLATHNDMRVLDFDGHHIFLNFSLRELGEGIVYEHERITRAA
jgi:hypothetical protein